MAISVSLDVEPQAPNHGDTVTATYTVTGNDTTPATPETVTGDANVGGTDFPVTASVTLPGTSALAETFTVPTASGLTFTATAQPNVFTAIVP